MHPEWRHKIIIKHLENDISFKHLFKTHGIESSFVGELESSQSSGWPSLLEDTGPSWNDASTTLWTWNMKKPPLGPFLFLVWVCNIFLNQKFFKPPWNLKHLFIVNCCFSWMIQKNLYMKKIDGNHQTSIKNSGCLGYQVLYKYQYTVKIYIKKILLMEENTAKHPLKTMVV